MPETTAKPTLPETFDLAGSPLAGFNLIDASAGTGKTYTICGLVVRLLLEKNLSVDQILVVTYTEAATEDLRDRIRKKLRQALEAVKSMQSDDAFLQKYLPAIEDRTRAMRRLTDALRSFDEAAIFTIHSFCQRMLLENSFESNTLFDTELIADESHLVREIIEDYWRRNFYRCSKLFAEYAAAQLNPEALYDFLRTFIPHPVLQFIPAIDPVSGCSHLSETESGFAAAYAAVCQAWSNTRDAVCDHLLASETLKRNIYRKPAMPGLIAAMDAMAAVCRPCPHLFDNFQLFTSSRIAAATKAKEIPQVLPFYILCEELAQARAMLACQYDRCLLSLKKNLVDSFQHELARRKMRDNVFSFDDLLRRLNAAFRSPGGAAFAAAVAQKYPAALIDEFQDTDPLQYEIFSTIYRERSLLFLIGDPKQAIYSFRGADIFTYMAAAAASRLAHHTLGVNHRSTPALVKAVNTIFSRARDPFLFAEIPFQPVSPAGRENREQLTIDGQREEPFILWYFAGTPGKECAAEPAAVKDKHLSKSRARTAIISRVAAEVARLLSLAAENRAMIGDKRLRPGDIAVLVRKNDEARKMQQVLQKHLVPSVLHGGETLFASEEARELALLLEAIATPHDMRKVKTGLLTRLIGARGEDIDPAGEYDAGHEDGLVLWLTKFKAYHGLWSRSGFMGMFWTILRDNRVRARLLNLENGERSLTNFLHLAEILHQAEVDQGLNMTALLGCLHDFLARDQSENGEHQMRLESDDDRVKIVTVHKAKGLEYPVVFCPFTWEGSRLHRNRGCLFHRPDASTGRQQLVFDAGSPDLEKHMQTALAEEMAENLRLLYVALTRAVQRCYFAWGPIKYAETSAPAYLLHQPPAGSESRAPGSLMPMVAERFLHLSEHEIRGDLQVLADASDGTIRLESGTAMPDSAMLHAKAPDPSLSCREFTGTVAADWKISSFSSLTTFPATGPGPFPVQHETAPDWDGAPALQTLSDEEKTPAGKTYDLFSLPHGARTGSMLHELLEQVDFTGTGAARDKVIQEMLQRYGYEPGWHPAIATMLSHLGGVALHEGIPGLALANIPAASCLHELEFYFPLKRITPDTLRAVFISNHAAPPPGTEISMDSQLDRLTFAPARGFMRGFIDLVFAFQGKFYLVDWKSNYLGADPDNYHRARLGQAMQSGFYSLQYHIYCLALHLYLQNRWPDYRYGSHFGGVFYIFLRGVSQNLGPEYGIYYDLPSPATMRNLAAELLPAGDPGQPGLD